MVSGAFRSFRHEHIFETEGERTTMTDIFTYTVPYGIAGGVFNLLVLKRYMTILLTKRNSVIKAIAESDKWKKVLPDAKKP
jgi:ligand-binding SRPBCC domain-containing protein